MSQKTNTQSPLESLVEKLEEDPSLKQSGQPAEKTVRKVGVRRQKARDELVGKVYHRLTFIEYVRSDRYGENWKLKCSCGNIIERVAGYVRASRIKSCGCWKIEESSQRMSTHKLSEVPEYQIYHGMKQRCCNPDNTVYRNYGGRGITVCERWINSFESFYSDMGPRPSRKHSIDRIDNNGSYCPENCRWTTVDVQLFNRRTTLFLTYKGVTKPIREWCYQLNMRLETLKSRLRRGWDAEKIINQPIDIKSRKKSSLASSTIPATECLYPALPLVSHVL